jgi:uncharacterized protein (DUF1800 family)
MNPSSDPRISGPMDLWVPYTPSDQIPWNQRRVVHLHRRAGFAATWGEIQRDLKDGPQSSIDRLLRGAASAHTPAAFAATADLLADAAVTAGDVGRLKACWMYRMLFGPDPLGEKLTLLWHNHFATSNAKVRDLGAMRRQNDTFRKLALGPFGELANAALRDPALLTFLDAPANRKGHANENLARELLELFTLGLGHYTETDVKEAARALTGWTIAEGSFAESSAHHDDDEKTILGKKGKWTGSDLVGMLLDHPATTQRIAGRLGEMFFGEKALPAEAVKRLGEELHRRKLDVGWAVATILRSELFFADANIRTRVVSPVEFVVGAVRALEMFDPPPSTLALADWAGRLGQDLLEPPNVGGWPGGRAWLDPRAMISRANFVHALLNGPNVGRPGPFDPVTLAGKHGVKAEETGLFFARLLQGTEPSDTLRKRLAAAEGRKAVALLLAAPEGQVG